MRGIPRSCIPRRHRVSKSTIYNRMREEWASALAEGTAK